MDKGQKTALTVLGVAAATVTVIAIATRKSSAGGGGVGVHKYNVGDVIHNSDYNDNFLVQAILVENGVNTYYRMIRVSTGGLADFAITQVDNDTIWSLVQATGPKFQVGQTIYNPAVGTYPAYKITDIRTIQGLLRYVGVDALTGGYWDFPVALVDATWALLPISSTKFQVGQTIHNTYTGVTFTILAIQNLPAGLCYMISAQTGILVSVVDNDPNWVAMQ